MNNRNTRKNDVACTHPIKRNLDFRIGLLWITDYGMRGMLLSILLIPLIYIISIIMIPLLLKVVFKCNEIIFV